MTPQELAALHARCFERPAPFSERDFEGLLASAHTILTTAPGGFALGRAVADEAELVTLAVDPDHRRRGIGAQVLAAFEREVTRRGATELFLEVAEDNTAARALYLRAGFQAVGRRPGYYGRGPDAVDALTFCKRLGDAPV